jgi:hypothetical protein
MITHLAITLATSTEGKKSGPIGFAIILVLCVACYFLFRSMSRHMRKVREQFPADQPRLPEPADPRVLPGEQAPAADRAAGVEPKPPAED